MNFGRNFVKFGDFGHVRIFLTNEIQNPDHTPKVPKCQGSLVNFVAPYPNPRLL